MPLPLFRIQHGQQLKPVVSRRTLPGPQQQHPRSFTSAYGATYSDSHGGDLRRGTTTSSSSSAYDTMRQHVVDLLAARPPYRHELAAAPTPAIYEALQHLHDARAAYDRIQAFARYLLDERGEPPTPALYEALVRANCHTTRGSADAVRDVLRALGGGGGGGRGTRDHVEHATGRGPVEGTSGLYHGALAVLAVHPDYMLRSAVLQALRARWTELTADGELSLALGLLRDGQYERALDQLEAMAGLSSSLSGGLDGGETTGGMADPASVASASSSATVAAGGAPGWLYDIFIYVLAQKGFLDEAFTIVNHRLLCEAEADADGGNEGGASPGHRWQDQQNARPYSSPLPSWGAWGRMMADGVSRSGPATSGAAGHAASSFAGAAASPISTNIWYFLLDMCIRWGHYEGLVYVWRRTVVAPASTSSSSDHPNGDADGPGLGAGTKTGTESRIGDSSSSSSSSTPRMVTPSDAMALDVLNTAARHHDTALASEVLQLLAARGTKLGMPHFEAMIDCYAGAGAVDRALQALCIMHDAGMVPDAGCTRAIYQGLAGASTPASSVDDAVAALFYLRTRYDGVPIAAFNVVLEAILFGTRNKGTDNHETTPASVADQALDLYRQVRQLCPAGPNPATFHLLLRGCIDMPHLNFVAAEMRAFGVVPDAGTVDRLVYENARHGSLDVALQHMALLTGEEAVRAPETSKEDPDPDADTDTNTDTVRARRLRPWLSRRTTAALVQRCADEQDERIWAVAEASRARGRPLDALLRKVLHLQERPIMAPSREAAEQAERA